MGQLVNLQHGLKVVGALLATLVSFVNPVNQDFAMNQLMVDLLLLVSHVTVMAMQTYVMLKLVAVSANITLLVTTVTVVQEDITGMLCREQLMTASHALVLSRDHVYSCKMKLLFALSVQKDMEDPDVTCAVMVTLEIPLESLEVLNCVNLASAMTMWTLMLWETVTAQLENV